MNGNRKNAFEKARLSYCDKNHLSMTIINPYPVFKQSGIYQ